MPRTLNYPTVNLIRANVHRMITMHARPRQTDRQTDIMAIARRFVSRNASRAKTGTLLSRGMHNFALLKFREIANFKAPVLLYLMYLYLMYNVTHICVKLWAAGRSCQPCWSGHYTIHHSASSLFTCLMTVRSHC